MAVITLNEIDSFMSPFATREVLFNTDHLLYAYEKVQMIVGVTRVDVNHTRINYSYGAGSSIIYCTDTLNDIRRKIINVNQIVKVK